MFNYGDYLLFVCSNNYLRRMFRLGYVIVCSDAKPIKAEMAGKCVCVWHVLYLLAICARLWIWRRGN
ncbi:unnamed protein product [Ixodes persulcatus]